MLPTEELTRPGKRVVKGGEGAHGIRGPDRRVIRQDNRNQDDSIAEARVGAEVGRGPRRGLGSFSLEVHQGPGGGILYAREAEGVTRGYTERVM